MKLTRAIFLALAFLIPTVSTVAMAAEDPKTETPPPPDAKKAKKSKKPKKEGEEKKEGDAEKTPPPAK
jgi:hypothetical protein